MPDADVSIKWGTIAYDLDGSLFALSANKKHVSLYILTVGLLAEYAGDLQRRGAPGDLAEGHDRRRRA